MIRFFHAHIAGASSASCLRIAAALLAGALFFAPCAGAAPEQRELKTEDSEKVDAVLLLDASGSMLQTDPQRLRDEGAKLFVQFLRPGDRVAIIQFDRDAKLVRPFSEFKTEDVQSISTDVSKIEATGQYTDLLSGVLAAGDLLKKEKRADATPIIVLLSDGKEEPDPVIGKAHARTEELLNILLPELKATGIKIHTLALSELADKQLLSEIAVATDGVSWFTPDAEKIHQSYADLFLVVKKPQVLPLTSKGFSVDGDVQEATFYVNRDEGSELTLIPPEGKEIRYGQQDSSIKWFHGQGFDVITISEPKAGDWRVKGLTSADGFATVLTNLKLVSDWPSSITAGEPVILQARLNEGDKPVVLKEMSGATRYALQVIPTDKVAEPIIEDVLFDDGTHGDKISGDGIFSYKINIAEAGEYKAWIVAKGPTFDRRQQIPFRVKPPLVSISVVSGSEHGHGSAKDSHGGGGHGDEADAHGGGHDEHGHADAHGESSGKEKDDSHSAKDADRGIIEGTANDSILIELSPEVAVYKNIKIKLTAVDAQNHKLLLPVEREGDDLHYSCSANLLKRGGVYELQASMTADSKKRGTVHENSRTIKYNRVPQAGGDEKQVTEVVVEHSEGEAPVAPSSGFPQAILVLILNLAAGAGLMLQLKKARKEGTFVLPTFESSDVALAGVAELEARSALQEIELNDPILENEAVLPKAGAAVAAPAESAAVKAPPAPEEPPKAEAAPSEEGGE